MPKDGGLTREQRQLASLLNKIKGKIFWHFGSQNSFGK